MKQKEKLLQPMLCVKRTNIKQQDNGEKRKTKKKKTADRDSR